MSHDKPENIVSKARHSEELRHDEFWTPERLAAAKPVRRRVAPVSAVSKPWAVSPSAEGGRTTWHRGDLEEPTAHVEPMIAGALGVAEPLSYPYRTIGRLAFYQGGLPTFASAALIAPNILLTAAHCVYDSGEWSSHMVFLPSFPSRPTPSEFFAFDYHSLACWSSWTDDTSNYARDYAMVWLDAAPGKELGFLSLEWFGNPASLEGRRWEAVGYPFVPNPPFDGFTMDHTVGTFVPGDASDVIGLDNDNMGGGSSGGPWLTSLGSRHVNGVTSHGGDRGNFVSFSPFFTSKVYDLFQYISDPANR